MLKEEVTLTFEGLLWLLDNRSAYISEEAWRGALRGEIYGLWDLFYKQEED